MGAAIAGVAEAFSTLLGPAAFAAVACSLACGLGVRARQPVAAIRLLVWFTGVSASSCLLEILVDPSYAASLALIAIASLAFSLVEVKGEFLPKATMLVTCFFSLVFARSAITQLFRWAQEDGTLLTGDSTLLFQLCLLAVYALISALFALRPLRASVEIPRRCWVLLLSAPLAVAALSQLQTYFYINNQGNSSLADSAIFSLLALTSIVLIYAMTQTVASAFQQVLEQNAVNQQLSLTLDHIERTTVISEQVRTDKHEMKNILFYLQSLAHAEKWGDLSRALDAEAGHFELMEEYRTGNQLVDYLLTQKAAELRSAGIKTCFEVAVPASLPFEERDLCGLLSNLLDNAGEASAAEPADDAEVRLSMRIARGYLCIKVSNRCSRNVLGDNPRLRTTKERPSEHGIGLRVVRAITGKYDGAFSTSMEYGYFVASALLALPPGKEPAPKQG